ncbi:PREDICTED: uncharacterized protein LOC106147982 [Chinchilla lanigera]|uniref:uncharacterized protein LOC106147982 n=1 Tax=Chinchilla lanigera TaxID=34839 RepID=UPI000698A4E7|nr:PREDICTED: uncharacterized protein LOC106147982 [Chinchilla lanigera]
MLESGVAVIPARRQVTALFLTAPRLMDDTGSPGLQPCLQPERTNSKPVLGEPLPLPWRMVLTSPCAPAAAWPLSPWDSAEVSPLCPHCHSGTQVRSLPNSWTDLLFLCLQPSAAALRPQDRARSPHRSPRHSHQPGLLSLWRSHPAAATLASLPLRSAELTLPRFPCLLFPKNALPSLCRLQVSEWPLWDPVLPSRPAHLL